MKLVAFACAALALGLPAFALSQSSTRPVHPTISTGLVNADMPPERYRGNSVAVVVFTDREGIEAMCGKAEQGSVIIACHQRTKEGVSVITMPNPCALGNSEFYAKIACHEAAHGQGWGREHEL